MTIQLFVNLNLTKIEGKLVANLSLPFSTSSCRCRSPFTKLEIEKKAFLALLLELPFVETGDRLLTKDEGVAG
jgi:hypothetical protein